MNQGEFLYKTNNTNFKDINSIIPNEKKDRFFNV